MTLARRVCALVPVDEIGRPARRYLKGGLEVDFVEAVASFLANDGADEVWLRLERTGQRGTNVLFDPLRVLEQRVFVPLVAWAPVQSAADARLLLGFGADRVVVDVRAGLPDPVAFVQRIVDATGPDRVSAAIPFRRIADAGGVAFEVVDARGDGTGINARSLAESLPGVGVFEIVLQPTLAAPGSDRVPHDGDLIESTSSMLSIPLLSCGDDRDIADLATPLMMGADGVVTALFSSGVPTIPDARRALLEYGLPLRP